MNDFWKSYDITHAEYGADYRCYPLYGTVHLMELAISLAFIVGAALWYRRSSARTRRRILVGVTALLLLDEAALLLGMALTGQWNWGYLPLHLCNIQRLRLSVQHDHGQKLVQRGAVCPLYPGRNAGTALPQLAGCPLLVDAHQSALRQHPCPAGTLSSPAGGGRLPSQSPAGAAGAGVPVRLCPAHLLSESVP